VNEECPYASLLGNRGRLEERIADKRGAQSPASFASVNAEAGEDDDGNQIATDASREPCRGLRVTD
jgi:hypothetical protein